MRTQNRLRLLWCLMIGLGIVASQPQVAIRADSPTRIVYGNWTAEKGEICSILPDGTQPSCLPKTVDNDPKEPACSPDGKSVAFASHRDNQYDIYISSIDGVNVRRVTTTTDADERLPAWSPDGTQIAFSSEGTGYPVLSILNLNTKKTTELTKATDSADRPSWSPDGKQLVFEFQPDGKPMSITTVDITTRTQRVLRTEAFSPVWSPDGKSIAFVSAVEGFNRLNVLDLASQKLRLIDPGDAEVNDYAPSWSPDSKQIVFVRFDNMNYSLWIVNADGSKPYQLLKLAGDGLLESPSWCRK